MRMFILSAFVLSAALVGCDDGPTQVYSAAPAGAGNRWNDGMNPGFTVDAGQNFTNISGSNNLQQICTMSQEAARWAVMDTQPLQPPRYGAGLDLAGGDTWVGLTIEQAEQINCQSTNDGDQFGDGELTNQWGGMGEVWVEYDVTTRKIDQLTVWQGYTGPLSFTSVDGMHNYTIVVNMPMTRDGHNFPLDWVDPSGQASFDEMYRGLLHTFGPSLPQDPTTTTCFATGHCIMGNFGDVAYFYVPVLGLGLWIASLSQPQPEPSTFNRIDISPAKVLPYGFAGVQLQLAAAGPTASAGNLGMGSCVMQFGETFGNFLHDCVNVSTNMTDNMTEYNKLIGGIGHDTETWNFDVQGVDLNFADAELGTTDVVQDGTTPGNNDVAVQFSVDQSTLGPIQNDHDSMGNIDLHGTAALLREYARIVRTRLLADSGITDGTPAQVQANCLYPVPQPADFDPVAFQAAMPAYCTGFEGFIIPGNPLPGAHNDVNSVGLGNAVTGNPASPQSPIVPSMVIGIKPGHQPVAFCWDAGGLNSDGSLNGYSQCTSGDTFPTSFARVLQVFGHGQVQNLPPDAQDVRFFFKAWSEAFLKMLIAPTQADLSSISLNYDDLFFDSLGAGQFETMEYVDRRFASTTVPPTDFRLIADVKDGIFDEYEFTRHLYRGERTIYQGMQVHSTDGVGQEDNALLTNIFGSPLLHQGWTAGDATHSAYYCATHIDATHCGNQTPPLDANGNPVLDENGVPLLQPYPGAFGTTPFTLGPVGITITQTFPLTEEAEISVPVFADPYNTMSTARTPITVMVPWLPKQPGVGFPIALNGDLDRFVETYQLDFTGTTLTANVDYDFVVQVNPTTMMATTTGAIQFDAVETTDFLGEVFLCQDPTTLDLLAVRMYDPVSTILNWIQDHPGSTDACQIIVRASPFDNYPDYITSLSAGVRLGITQGGGFGRVVDGTLFVPGQ